MKRTSKSLWSLSDEQKLLCKPQSAELSASDRALVSYQSHERMDRQVAEWRNTNHWKGGWFGKVQTRMQNRNLESEGRIQHLRPHRSAECPHWKLDAAKPEILDSAGHEVQTGTRNRNLRPHRPAEGKQQLETRNRNPDSRNQKTRN